MKVGVERATVDGPRFQLLEKLRVAQQVRAHRNLLPIHSFNLTERNPPAPVPPTTRELADPDDRLPGNLDPLPSKPMNRDEMRREESELLVRLPEFHNGRPYDQVADRDDKKNQNPFRRDEARGSHDPVKHPKNENSKPNHQRENAREWAKRQAF